MTEPPPDQPARVVRSGDGTPIAVFTSGAGSPVVLVHGAAADHTTFRVVGPRLALTRSVHAIDRRGRGRSGDAATYDLGREFDDLAAVVDAVADETGSSVDVVGHSFGGRVGLGAALRTPRLRRLVVYEGAPPADPPYEAPGTVERLRAILETDGPERLLETFLAEIAGQTPVELAAYRANPVWPARVAAAPSIIREVEASAAPAAGVDALSGVSQPVLQILGGDSRPPFRAAVEALDRRLRDGRVAVIDGARHAAHHTHPDEFLAAVTAFLDGD